MKRVHLFEVEDLSWFPASLRDMITGLLGTTIEVGHLYDPIVPLLAEALRATGDRRILDLCSGGGGPLPELRKRLARNHGLDVEVCLSDLYPNLGAFELAASHDHSVSFVEAPVDATRVPPDLPGLRTMFSSLHHFRPEQAAAILRDAWQRRRGIGVFEISDRSLAGIGQALMGPVSAYALTPLVRPLRLSRFALTYGVPVVPALFTFDGIVSALRTYTLVELREMTVPLQGEGYRWEIGQAHHAVLPTKVTYLLGVPQRIESRASS
jgi:hypothetical protein